MPTDLDSLIDWCRERRIPVTRTRKSHWRVQIPGGPIIVTAGTPSDHRASRNFRARLRRELRAAGWHEADLP